MQISAIENMEVGAYQIIIDLVYDVESIYSKTI